MKIRTKLQLVFIGMALLLAISFLSIVYSSMVGHFEQQVGNELKENVRLSAKEIDDFMFTRVKDFNMLSNNPLFSMSSSNTLSDYLFRVVEQYPYYEHISLVNPEAVLMASSKPEELGLNLFDLEPHIKPEFNKALNGGDDDVYISDKALMIEARENSHLDIEILSNVIDLNGNVIGVLVGVIDFDFIRTIVKDIDNRTIGNEYAYLVDDPGNVIVTENPEVNGLDPHPDLNAKNLQQKLEGDKNGFDVYENSKGIKVISGYADLSEYGTEKIGDWSIVSTAPYEDVMAPINQMLYKAIGVFSIVLLGILLLIIVISRSMTKPLMRLKEAFSAYDMESEPLELNVGTNDEVGRLGKSFNELTKKLYKSSEESKVIRQLLSENKNYLVNIIDNIGSPIFVKDDQCRLIIVNNAFCKFFDVSKSEVLAKTNNDDFNQEEGIYFLEIDRQVLDDGIENVNEEVFKVNEKESRIISTTKTRYVDENGARFLIGVMHDVTESKNAEKNLKKANERSELFALATNDALWDWEMGNPKVWWNNGVTELFGHVHENNEAPPEWWLENIHPEDRERLEKLLAYSSNMDRDSWVEEYRFKCSDGTYKNVYDRGLVRRDENGNVIRMLGALMDVTQGKQAEIALKSSEEKFRTLLDFAPVGIFLFNNDGQNTFVNEAHASMLGFTVEESIGSDWVKAIHPDDVDRVGEEFKLAMDSNKPFISTGRYLHEAGDVVYWKIVTAPIIVDGKIESHVGVTIDISEKAEADATNQKLISLIESDDDFIGIASLEGKPLYLNKLGKEMVGLAHDKELPAHLNGFFPKDYHEVISNEHMSAIMTIGKWSGEAQLQHFISGDLIPIEMSGFLIEDPLNKKPVAIGIVARDISENKNAEEKLKEALHKALESDRLKSAFLANMSHEIRTPMNGIVGFINLLNDPDLSRAQIDQYSAIINKSSDRLLNTINDIIDFSKIEAEEMQVVNSAVSINGLVEELYAFHAPEAEQKGLSFKLELPKSIKDINIFTDSQKLHGILSNLIKNAVKYTKEGNINFGYSTSNNQIEFYVKDTGIGIPEDRIHAVFNRFEQADIEDTVVLEGSGLGLAISKAYAEMIGGDLFVESEKGKGSLFTFTMPFSNLEKNEVRQPEKKDNQTNSTENLNLLIVEDDVLSAELLETTLKDKFSNIVFAENGVEAVEMCKTHPEINLVLMDIKMPIMNGYEATKEIRKFNKDLLIIAQTAYTMVGDKEKSIEAGCNDYITKPIDKMHLFKLINEHLNKRA